MKQKYEDYESGLQQSLSNEEEAAAYLNAALEDGSQDAFLMALRDVANARGLSRLARNASLNRENMYRILSAKGNPQLSSLNTLLDALGLKLAIETKKASAFAVAEENEPYMKS
ncbi:MAG: putative addiction module antidote protein [Kiritimatiellae bacterium]|jgi:probable addiction module antidote protein|nr:putative addiction module antidote protein [Kiritimatiellia bacterium]